jgi:hypothetical protein
MATVHITTDEIEQKYRYYVFCSRLNKDMEVWLENENIECIYCIDYTGFFDRSLRFKYEKDALRFKLTWT